VRPNIVKPKPTPAPQTNDDPEGEQAGVPETQVPAVLEDEFGSDLDGDSDYASDASHTPRRKVPAKIKATANANYRRLNIKGKAGTGAKGKFGRRR
jgi:hypothetical protein